MKARRSLIICAVVALAGLAVFVNGQSVSVPLRHDVYEFLKKMEAVGYLKGYADIVRPIERHAAAQLLLQVEDHATELGSTDLRRLTFFKEEFGYELGFADSSWIEAPRRWHPVSLELNQGIFNVDLNLAYGMKRSGADKVTKRSNGLRFYGYAFGNLGFSFNFADNHEEGNALDLAKSLSHEDGLVPARIQPNFFEYDFTHAQVSYDFGDAVIAIENVPQSWSLGRRGSLSFSSKAPPAAQIRFHARVSDWLTLTYIHGELNSQILDSARSYPAGSSAINPFFRPVYRQKYIAGHMLQITPVNGVDIGLGESIVYSDRNPSLIYLLPIMFFKSGEHYNGDTDNSQFHVSADITVIPRFNFYGSLIIDEFSFADFLDENRARNQVGWTVGFQTFDLPFQDVEWTVEYTRINPWVYYHKYPAARFTNAGYDMGHWIGQNADNLFSEIVYRPARDVRVSGSFERVRKGGLKDVAFQYIVPSQPFLYGPVRTLTSFGLNVVYQPVRDVFLEGSFASVSRTDELYPSAEIKGKPEFAFRLRYGVW